MSLEEIVSWLGKLGGLPGYTLVFLFCIAAIKTMRSFNRFPNDGIWLATLLLGSVLNSFIADPMADNLSLRVWIVKNAVVGGIVGFVAVLAYNKVLKKLFSFFDGGDEGDTDVMGRPPTPPKS